MKTRIEQLRAVVLTVDDDRPSEHFDDGEVQRNVERIEDFIVGRSSTNDDFLLKSSNNSPNSSTVQTPDLLSDSDWKLTNRSSSAICILYHLVEAADSFVQKNFTNQIAVLMEFVVAKQTTTTTSL